MSREGRTARARPPARRAIALAVALGLAGAGGARAELEPETPGHTVRLGAPSPHWIWVGDVLHERVQLVDLDAGRLLGMLDVGYGMSQPLVPRTRPEIYVPATYYARHTRGERTDVLAIYDAPTLAPVAEVRLPGRRAIDNFALAHAALSDDERFVAVFNWTPATSLSIVDVERRTFVGEIAIPGCSLVYAAGARRFLSLCADGSLLVLTIDGRGRATSTVRTAPFFDPERDPVTEKAVRAGGRWYFVSFAGRIHPVDVSGPIVRFDEPWALTRTTPAAPGWRPGGVQHLAAHAPSGRLYVLMHEGPPDTHKDPGSEVWVFDTRTHARLARVRLRHPGLTVMGEPVALWDSWPWPFAGAAEWLVDALVPPIVTQIAVTGDDQPLLVTASRFTGGLGLYDATTGAFVRRVSPVGWTLDVVTAPYGGAAS